MLARLVPTALLGAALLAPAALPAEGTAEPWGRTCALAWCDPSPSAPVVQTLEAALADAVEVARAGAGRGCRPPARWPGDELPASMVIRLSTEADATVEPWTYPAPPGSEVVALCARPVRTPPR